MHPSKEEAEIRSKVLFYSASTVVYIPMLLLVLVWTGWIYFAGDEKFNLVSSLVLLGELVKPSFGALYFNSLHVKRSEEKVLTFKSQAFLKLGERARRIAVVITMIFVYFFAAVVYGANIFEKYESTFIFSGLLTALTIVPVTMNLGTTSVLPLLLGTKPTTMMETLLSQNLYLSVLGAWLGAFVIPLDWDRPWQVWPIPCVFGMLFGYTLSHFVMLCRLGLKTRKKNRRNI